MSKDYCKMEKFSFNTISMLNVKRLNDSITSDPNKKICIIIPNTKGISSSLIRQLDKRIYVRVVGSYDNERIMRVKNNMYDDGRTGFEHFIESVVYTKDELADIIEKMERIERKINQYDLATFEKIAFLYDSLRRNISYDEYHEEKFSDETRSLRGFLSARTVCAGYAVMFKELLDRQGIECHYVEGMGILRDGTTGAHAWNVVCLDGKFYPIDLTWDSSHYNHGVGKGFEFFCEDVKAFSRSHIPYDNEPLKNYSLSELDSKTVEKIKNKISRARDYYTCFSFTRDDGSKYKIQQIGQNDIDGVRYYRYYLREDSKDQSYVLFTGTNICEMINSKENVPNSIESVNTIFSKNNINDSINSGSFYLGVIEQNNNGHFIIKKDKDKMKKFSYRTKEITRKDRSKFLIQEQGKYLLKNEFIDNEIIRAYFVFEIIKEPDGRFNYLQENLIYSEQDLISDNRPEIANYLLSRERINRKVGEAGGYVGYCDERKQIVHNSKIESYFKSYESVGTRGSTILSSINESRKRKKIQLCKEFLRDYEDTEQYDEYKNRRDNLDSDRLLVLKSVKNGYFPNILSRVSNPKEKIAYFGRLLKAAQNLTIDGFETNYFNEFISIKDVDEEIMKVINTSEYSRRQNQANNNRKNNSSLKPERTWDDADCFYAQEYLKRMNNDPEKIKAEVGGLKRIIPQNILVVGKIPKIEDIPKELKEIISIQKILIKQTGKRLGNLTWNSKIGWYFDIISNSQTTYDTYERN